MPYKTVLFDDFNDNSLNTSKWTPNFADAVTETGGRLNIPSTASYPNVRTQQTFDLRDGIIAAKVYKSGTATQATEIYFGLRDPADNANIDAFFTPANADFDFNSYGNASVGGSVWIDTTVGLGPSWVGGTWLGLGNVRYNGLNTDWLTLYKSTDGINWTVMGYCDVHNFNLSAAQLNVTCGVWESPNGTTLQFEDVAYFEYRTRVRSGAAWTTGKPKVRVNGAWVTARPQARSDGVWKVLR